MNKLKEYIKKKKVDNTFKHLGKGYVLSDGQSSSQPPDGSAGRPSPSQSSADARARAAAAVEKRWNESANKMSSSQRAIYMQAKRELEKEQQMSSAPQSDERALNFDSQQSRQSDTAEDESVLYTCDLLTDLALSKSDIREAVEIFLRSQLEDEAVCSSILMIHSLNKPSQTAAAIETIQKYLTNICNNPAEQKFRKIRKSNKVYQEKIVPVNGAEEFLKAVGFVDKEITDANGTETYLVMPEEAAKPADLQDALQELRNGSAVTIRLFRDPKVYSIDPNKTVPIMEPPADFFNVKVSEVRQKHEEHRREVERLTTLRTRKMREEDAGTPAVSAYKRAVVRIRFPNHFVLQGLFNASEPTQAVREFVHEHLDYSEGEFILHTSTGSLADERTLAENGLAPSSVINFVWADSALAHFASLQFPPTYLKCALERDAEVLA